MARGIALETSQAEDRDAVYAGAQEGADPQTDSIHIQATIRADKGVLYRHDAMRKRIDGVRHLAQLVERPCDCECCIATVAAVPGKLLTLRARKGRLLGCGRNGRNEHPYKEGK